MELRGNHSLRIRASRRGPRIELQLEPTSATLSPDEREPARIVVDGARASLKSNLEGPRLFGERIGEFETRDHWALTARVPNARYTCSELAIRIVEFAYEHLFAPRNDGWRKWSRQDRDQAREVMADVRRLYAEFARLAFVFFDGAQLAIARRFRPELRWIAYRWMRRDGSGRIAQLAEACPGAVLFGIGCRQELYAPEVWSQIDRDARAGRPLDALLGDALKRWLSLDHGCLEPYCFDEAAPRVALASADAHTREALLRRKRLLLRRMREAVTAEAAVMPPPAALVPEDIPGERWANARWFRTMSCSAVLVGTNTPWQREIEGLCRLLSRHAGMLKGSPHGLEDRVRTLANYTLRLPPRTEPQDLLDRPAARSQLLGTPGSEGSRVE